MNSYPRRSPEPGRPFINREQELQLIQDKLNMGLQGKEMSSTVVCFWGPFGMGKSWLLMELERRYRCVERRLDNTYPTITARLDLSRIISKDAQNRGISRFWQDGQLNREALIKELWQQLALQLGVEVSDLGRASPEEWA